MKKPEKDWSITDLDKIKVDESSTTFEDFAKSAAKHPEETLKELERIDRELYLDSLNEPDVEDIIIEFEAFCRRLPEEKLDHVDISIFSMLSPKERHEYEEYLKNVPAEEEEYVDKAPITKNAMLSFEEYRKLTPKEKVKITPSKQADIGLKYGSRYTEEKLEFIFSKQSLLPSERERASFYSLDVDEKVALKKSFNKIMSYIGLTEKQRNVAFWYYFWGIKDQKWIANAMGITQQAVSKHVKFIDKKIEKTIKTKNIKKILSK